PVAVQGVEYGSKAGAVLRTRRGLARERAGLAEVRGPVRVPGTHVERQLAHRGRGEAGEEVDRAPHVPAVPGTLHAERGALRANRGSVIRWLLSPGQKRAEFRQLPTGAGARARAARPGSR
ncbi:unnamed protein product, partial [Gulo gulo]